VETISQKKLKKARIKKSPRISREIEHVSGANTVLESRLSNILLVRRLEGIWVIWKCMYSVWVCVCGYSYGVFDLVVSVKKVVQKDTVGYKI
jgi:hypothetical protein